jgi:hypothetical protein
VRQYSTTVHHLHPKGPVTGTTLDERAGRVTLLKVVGEDSIIALPRNQTAVPLKLYEMRKYDIPAPRAIPMPRPTYSSRHESTEKEIGLVRASEGNIAGMNRCLSESDPAAWMERFVRRCAGDAMKEAMNQVVTLSPVPGVELLRRTKYPSPQSIKFATLARKPVPGNLAVGGLAAEITIQEMVQTVVPPQFGDLTVMHKTSVAPNVSAEVTAWFEPAPLEPDNQSFVDRPLQHALNTRVAPCIMIPTAADPSDRHWYRATPRVPFGDGSKRRSRVWCLWFSPGMDGTDRSKPVKTTVTGSARAPSPPSARRFCSPKRE